MRPALFALLVLGLLATACDDDPSGPDDRPDPVLWLRADTLAPAHGAALSSWHDVSGRGHHAVQSTEAHRPTYDASAFDGRGGIRFFEACSVNGPLTCPRQFLEIPGIGSEFADSAATVIVLASVDDVAYAIYGTGESNDPAECDATFCDQWWRFEGFNPMLDGHGFVGAFHRARIELWPANPPTSGTHLFVLRTDSVYEFMIDGVGPAPAEADFVTGMTHDIGAGDTPSDGSTQAQRFFNGIVAEVMVFNQALNDDDLAYYVDYLEEKWGL